jgi:hypothetical protein
MGDFREASSNNSFKNYWHTGIKIKKVLVTQESDKVIVNRLGFIPVRLKESRVKGMDL